ncbi:MAG: MATE family efflux transporter [Anaerolineales bacterium]|nr:MATE family efflux transporter [Anaerolineales bacterium]
MNQAAKSSFKSISQRMFKIAIPIAISGIITQIQMLIDTAFLGRYSIAMVDGSLLTGSDILSAVGNVFFPYIVSLSFIWSITTGTVILVSQRVGANEPEKARRFAETSIKFNTLLSLVVLGFWFLFAEKIFVFLGVREPILGLSLKYIRLMSLELVYLGAAVTIGAVFQGAGFTRPEMITGIIRSLLNMLLDYLLIFGHFGFPEMGIAGAGLATALSGVVSFILLLVIFFTHKDLPFRPQVRSVLRAPIKEYGTVLKVGLPVGVEDVLWNSGNLVLAYFLNLINQEAVGIYRLVYQIEITPIFFYIGLARAVTTLVGNRTGARNIPEARRVGLIGTLYTAGFCLLFTSLFVVFPQHILRLFTTDTLFIQQAIPLLGITAFTLIPRSINIISGHGIRGYGDTIWMLATQIFGIVFIISLSYTLMFTVDLKMIGLFIAIFTDEMIRGVINTVRFYRGETSIFHKGITAEPAVDAV